MTLEEIQARPDITSEEIQHEIDKREEWIFYALMAENYNSKIDETRRVINILKMMLEMKQEDAKRK